MSRKILCLVALLAPLPGLAEAGCRMAAEGARCVTVAPSPGSRTGPLARGEDVPDDARLVMNPRYWGLPPVESGQRFYVVGREVYRVDAGTMQVIERVFGANPGLF